MLQLFLEPYLFIFFMSFLLGFLHTILPCEDKAIFLFWSLGISKSPKKSVLILALYGCGLILANMIIAAASILITSIPYIFGFDPDSNAINFFGALSSIIAAVILTIFISKGDYMPHSIANNKKIHQQFNWERLQTPVIFGTLAGFAPCIFELIIYTQCIQYNLSAGFVEAFIIVFFFSLGTFVGLFPLAIAKLGTSQIIKRKSSKRSRIVYAMLIVIIVFNIIVMILSVLNIQVFPVVESI